MRVQRIFLVLISSTLALNFSARAQDSPRMERFLGVLIEHHAGALPANNDSTIGRQADRAA